jgi:hypothetical protein
LPFACIAFLWFIGVVRDLIGDREDRFFATVFLGSGLLFIAMLLASAAIASGLMFAGSHSSAQQITNVWSFGGTVTHTLLTIHVMRMAAVFAISTTTIVSRHGLVPRWLVVLGFGTGGALLPASDVVPWLELVFPAWVLVLSIHILVVATKRSRVGETELAPPN